MIMIDITTRFGIEFNPFLKNSKFTLVNTKEFKEVQTRLKYLQETKGFGLITGEPGIGKTTALKLWASELNKSLFKVIYTPLSTLTVLEFYINICQGLGIETPFRKTNIFKAIQDEILRYNIEKHITPVFIFDEANYAKSAILNDLKILFNFDMDSKDRAIVILSGLPQLANILNYSSHEPLRQRIIMNYHMEGLTKTESKEYINVKLQKANASKQIFDDNSLEAIVNASGGIPRLINKYCNASLNIANASGLDLVNIDVFEKAYNDCLIK